MNNTEWMKIRHSVRQYDGKPLAKPIEEELRTLIAQINKKSGQDFQLLVDEPKAFSGTMAHYGKFSGVVNYIALVGNSEEKLGYYGEEIVKRCTLLGLKTCWVGMTYKKEKSLMHVKAGEKIYGVIALGTSLQNGNPHPMHSISELALGMENAPSWFLRGMEGVQLAPSAINQQKYRFTLKDGVPQASKGIGFYTAMDLGIAKYHFNEASGKEVFVPGA